MRAYTPGILWTMRAATSRSKLRRLWYWVCAEKQHSLSGVAAVGITDKSKIPDVVSTLVLSDACEIISTTLNARINQGPKSQRIKLAEDDAGSGYGDGYGDGDGLATAQPGDGLRLRFRRRSATAASATAPATVTAWRRLRVAATARLI